jgi:hypothetical protein
MQDMMSAVTTRIEKEFEYRELTHGRRKQPEAEEVNIEGLDIRKIKK